MFSLFSSWKNSETQTANDSVTTAVTLQNQLESQAAKIAQLESENAELKNKLAEETVKEPKNVRFSPEALCEDKKYILELERNLKRAETRAEHLSKVVDDLLEKFKKNKLQL
jgi:hypothetical protein